MKYALPQALFLVACLSLLSWGQSDPAACNTTPPASYTIIDLGTLGGTVSYAAGINSVGDVAGQSYLAGDSTHEHAFLWKANGGMIDLGTLSGGSYSQGIALNSSDEVVGIADTGVGFTQHAFLWTSSGGMQDLGSLGASTDYSYAFGIDDRSRVVGGSYANATDEYSTIWINGQVRSLSPTSAGEARAISTQRGYVAGLGAKGDAFVWTKAGGFTDLGRLSGGTISFAYGVNNSGQAVGYSDFGDPLHTTTAFFWSKAVGIESMGTLGWNPSTAEAINDQCLAVGYSIIADQTNEHAFIWSQATGMLDLNSKIPPNSGWVLTLATGINASGQIVGQGTINRQSHAFLLTPVN